ncbi:hypothetical protein DXV76_17990 [Rhodobacteraceae bacterium CCMM004]|nr:hypothetical protein DXV76_17990 [Rhodobacteraceae bacterium CCMM004]
MEIVVYHSLTGNNRVLAAEIARRLGVSAVEVEAVRRRRIWTVFADMILRRDAAIRPLPAAAHAARSAVFVGPVYDMGLAAPLRAAVAALAPGLDAYDFASLCGWRREGEPEAVRAALTAAAGRPPRRMELMAVEDMMPAADKGRVTAIAAQRIGPADLGHWSAQIDRLTAPDG